MWSMQEMRELRRAVVVMMVMCRKVQALRVSRVMMMQGVSSGTSHGRAATARSERSLHNFNAEKRLHAKKSISSTVQGGKEQRTHLSRLPIHTWVAAYCAEVRQHALPQSTLSTMYEPPPVLTTIFMQCETGGVES